MSLKTNYQPAAVQTSKVAYVPSSPISYLMYYLKVVKFFEKKSAIESWAMDYQNYKLNENQLIQLWSWLQDYSPQIMMDKGLFIEVKELQNNHLNLYFNKRNQDSCQNLPEELKFKLKNTNSMTVLLFIPKWVETSYTIPMKKILSKYNRIIQIETQINYTN
jgi:hypothetical protein